MADEPLSLGVYFEGRPVGTVAAHGSGRFTFEYADRWVSDAGAFPISHSLPLEGSADEAQAGHTFFSNLLPEGQIRERVARHLGVSAGNDFALLDALGGECAGALVISRQPPISKTHSYRPLNEKEIADWASQGLAFAETSGTDGIRLSLAGAQDKLPVRLDGSKLFLPEGDSPSTHILKFANPNYSGFPENELFVTKLAGLCGLPTVGAELRTIEKTRHLLVERYDRVVDAGGTIHRLHQEDFCQALGVPPVQKYEQEGGPRFAQCFGLVDDESVEPALDTRALLRWLVFNVIAGNADGHAKNLSLLLGANGPRLAPFYDLLCTAIYPSVSARLAMSVNGNADPGQISGKDWRALATSIRVGRILEDAIIELVEEMPGKARQLSRDLETEYGGMGIAESIAQKISARARRTKRLLTT